jgi:hypothetical protein
MFFWMKNQPPRESDGRLKGTVIVWVFATMLFTVSIPVAALMQSALLPLVVLGGATLATALVWLLGNRTQTASQKRIDELEERIANLETLICFSSRDDDASVSFLQDDLCNDLPSASQRVRAKVAGSRQKVTY